MSCAATLAIMPTMDSDAMFSPHSYRSAAIGSSREARRAG
jgi:hypothetical protein